MTATTERRSLDLLRWFRAPGWARRRAVLHASRRHVPILLISHPKHGYAAVSERLYQQYDNDDCTVVERVEAS